MASGIFDDLKPRRSSGVFDDLRSRKSSGVFDDLRVASPSSVGIAEGIGASALGALSAVNTAVSSTLGSLSRVPTLGEENPVSRMFRDIEQTGKALTRPKDARLVPTYELSESVGMIPATLGKYAAAGYSGGALAPILLGTAEAVGARPEESEAAMVGKLAGKAGFPTVQRTLEAASTSPIGRALTSVGLAKGTEALLSGGSKALGALRRTEAVPAPTTPPASGVATDVAESTVPRSVAPVSEADQLTLGLDDATQTTARTGSTMPPAARREQPLMQPQEITGYANWEKFSDDPLVQERLKRTASQFVSEFETPLRVTVEHKQSGLYPGKKVGDLIESESLRDVQKKVASELGVDPSELVTRAKNGETLGRYDLLHVRTAINDVLAEEEAYFKILNSATASPDEIAKAQLRLAELNKERNALFGTFTTQRTETGRNLSALRATALRTADPITWMARAQRLAQRPLTEEERAAIIKAADMKDFGELNKLANDLTKFSMREKFLTLIKTNVLTSFKSQLSNFGGNLVSAGLEQGKEYPAFVFDRLLMPFTGVSSKSASALNPKAVADASLRGAENGAKEFMRVMRGERPMNAAVLDNMREVKFDNKALNWYVGAVRRTMGATDELFKNIAISRSLDEQARVLAQAEGKTGQAFADRVQQLIAKPTDEMSMRAMGDAEIATFQENSKLASAAEKIKDVMNIVPGAGDLLFLFRRTPANIAKRIYEYTPLGILSQGRRLVDVVYRGKSAEQRELANALGRITTGSTLGLTLGYHLAKDGKMTGFFPSNQRERDAWEEQGKLEGAIKLTEKSPWIQIAKYSPFGNLLQIGAAMYNMDQDVNVSPGEYAFGALTAPVRAVSELPMVASLSDAFEVAQKAGTPDAADAAIGLAGRTIGAMVPGSGMLRSIASGVDPIARETRGTTVAEGIKNQVLAGIPGLSQTLPVKVDPLGKVTQRPFGLAGSMFIPSQVRADLTQEDFVRKELERTGAVVGRVKRTKAETGDEYAVREQQIGTAIRNALASVIATDPIYQTYGQIDPTMARRLLAYENSQRPAEEQVDLSRINDERIRARLQGYYLEKKADQVKNVISRAQSKGQARIPTNIRSAMEAITR